MVGKQDVIPKTGFLRWVTSASNDERATVLKFLDFHTFLALRVCSHPVLEAVGGLREMWEYYAELRGLTKYWEMLNCEVPVDISMQLFIQMGREQAAWRKACVGAKEYRTKLPAALDQSTGIRKFSNASSLSVTREHRRLQRRTLEESHIIKVFVPCEFETRQTSSAVYTDRLRIIQRKAASPHVTMATKPLLCVTRQRLFVLSNASGGALTELVFNIPSRIGFHPRPLLQGGIAQVDLNGFVNNVPGTSGRAHVACCSWVPDAGALIGEQLQLLAVAFSPSKIFPFSADLEVTIVGLFTVSWEKGKQQPLSICPRSEALVAFPKASSGGTPTAVGGWIRERFHGGSAGEALCLHIRTKNGVRQFVGSLFLGTSDGRLFATAAPQSDRSLFAFTKAMSDAECCWKFSWTGVEKKVEAFARRMEETKASTAEDVKASEDSEGSVGAPATNDRLENSAGKSFSPQTRRGSRVSADESESARAECLQYFTHATDDVAESELIVALLNESAAAFGFRNYPNLCAFTLSNGITTFPILRMPAEDELSCVRPLDPSLGLFLLKSTTGFLVVEYLPVRGYDEQFTAAGGSVDTFADAENLVSYERNQWRPLLASGRLGASLDFDSANKLLIFSNDMQLVVVNVLEALGMERSPFPTVVSPLQIWLTHASQFASQHVATLALSTRPLIIRNLRGRWCVSGGNGIRIIRPRYRNVLPQATTAAKSGGSFSARRSLPTIAPSAEPQAAELSDCSLPYQRQLILEREATLNGHSGRIYAMEYDGGRRLASIDNREQLIVWDIVKLQKICQIDLYASEGSITAQWDATDDADFLSHTEEDSHPFDDGQFVAVTMSAERSCGPPPPQQQQLLPTEADFATSLSPSDALRPRIDVGRPAWAKIVAATGGPFQERSPRVGPPAVAHLTGGRTEEEQLAWALCESAKEEVRLGAATNSGEGERCVLGNRRLPESPPAELPTPPPSDQWGEALLYAAQLEKKSADDVYASQMRLLEQIEATLPSVPPATPAMRHRATPLRGLMDARVHDSRQSHNPQSRNIKFLHIRPDTLGLLYAKERIWQLWKVP